MNKTAAFIMPVKITGSEMDLRFFKASVESIKRQTDRDWILVIVEDYSNDKRVYDAIDEMKDDLKDKLHVIYSDKNYGTGAARNKGVLYAKEIGAPFILFNDADDLSDPRRLELVREKFQDENTNVVYLSFDVIDEHDIIMPDDRICLSVREIINGHHYDVTEGEDAWIDISTKKNYTNLTSCTAVRTWLAAKELFPQQSVSEDAHTWLRYGAYPGKFAFIGQIKNKYRICSEVESRSRGQNNDFYPKKAKIDSDGFEQAMALSRAFGRIKPEDENRIRTAFYVREALSMIYGDSDSIAKQLLQSAVQISRDETLKLIDQLSCGPEFKTRLKALTTTR